MKEKNVFSVMLFAAALLGFSFYGLLSDSSPVQLLINLDMLTIYARIILVVILLTYLFVPALRTYTARTLLYASGISMIILGASSIISSTLMAYTTTHILLLDSLLLVEAGILSIILSADLSAKRSRMVANSFCYIQSLLPIPQSEARTLALRRLK